MVLQEHFEAKLNASSEELMKLVENAHSGGLEPGRLSDVLSAASVAVGQDCRSQLLMQLIVLIQQQLAATSTDTTAGTQSNTTNASANVKLLQDDSMSAGTSVEGKELTVNTASKDTANTNKENEMDKLLSWKTRIENASLKSTVDEQSKVIPDPASPDEHIETDGKSPSLHDNNAYSFAASSGMTSCVVTDVVQSVVSHLSDVSSPVLSPASPPVQYPPLPKPPKPPGSLLMSMDCSDRRNLSCELFAPALPLLPALDSAVCSSSASPLHSDVCKSSTTACHPCFSVPCSLDTVLSSSIHSSSAEAQPAWAVSNRHGGSQYPVTSASDAVVPLSTSCHDASCETIDSACVEPLSTRNTVSDAWHYDSSTFSQLQSAQEVHGEHKRHSARTPSQDLSFQYQRGTRLKSPSAWLSRLASPSAFMLQSCVSRVRPAANTCPEAVFSRHKLASRLDTTGTSHSVHCGQCVSPEQQHSPCPVDNHHSVEQSTLFMPHSKVADQLNLTMDKRQLRDFDDVSSHGKRCVPEYEEESVTEYSSIVTSQLTAHGNHSSDDTLGVSTDRVLMRLAGMPFDSDMSGDHDQAVVSETDAVLTASSQHEEQSSQNAVQCNVTSGSLCGIENSDCSSTVGPTVDQAECETANTAGWHSPVVSCAVLSTSSVVTVQSSQQTVTVTDCNVEQQQDVVHDDDLEEGEIVDDCSQTPAVDQHEFPQATKQLLFFLKTDPVRKSSSSQWLQPHRTVEETPCHRRDDRHEDLNKYRRTDSSSRRRW